MTSITDKVVAIANEKDTCLVTLLLEWSDVSILPELWTTATTENVKVYSGVDQANLYFEFKFG